MSDSITNFAADRLQAVVNSNADDQVRVDAIKTLLSLKEQNRKEGQQRFKKSWYEASISDIGMFLLKVVVAALPATVLMGVFYVLILVVVNVASQLLLGG